MSDPPEVVLILTDLPQGDGGWRGTRSSAEVRFTGWSDEYGYTYEVDVVESAFVSDPMWDDEEDDERLRPLKDGVPT